MSCDVTFRSRHADFHVTEHRVKGRANSFARDADLLLTRAGDLALERAADHGGVTTTTLAGVTTSRGYRRGIWGL